jgi:hypothetical protein
MPGVPRRPASVRQDVDVGLTKDERSKAIDLIQRLLGMVEDGSVAVDGRAGVALFWRLEGTMLALRVLDSYGTSSRT